MTGTSTLSRQASIDITAGRVMVPNACWVSRLLAAGKAVGIYPEGTHSPHGRLHKFRTGLARLACTPAVIPVGLVGTGRMPFLRVVHPCGPTEREALRLRGGHDPSANGAEGDNRHGGR